MAKQFPITGWSCFFGTCLFIAVLAALGAVLALAGLNYSQFYRAPKSECVEQNASAMFGFDNILFCPNTHIVSKVTTMLAATGIEAFGMVAHRLDQRPNSTVSLEPSKTSVRWNTKQLGITQIWWLFWLNKGSTLNITVGDTQTTIAVSINDVNNTIVSPPGRQQILFTAPEDSQYKVLFQTNSATANTELSFELVSVIYDVPLPPLDQLCIPLPNSTLSCTFDIDFRSSQCVYIRMRPGVPRYWQPNYVGSCIIFTTEGFDYFWAGLLLPSALVIVLCMLGAIMIGHGARRKCVNTSRSHALQEVYSDASDYESDYRKIPTS